MVLRLEVFDNATSSDSDSSPMVVLDSDALEEAKLAAYESGYSAGWEDANAAQSEDHGRMTTEFAHNLQSLSFTYHEARAHVLKAVEPILAELVGRVLPEMARESLATLVLETLMPLAEELADVPVSLILNPASRPAVESLLEAATDVPVTIVDEPTVGEGQAYLKLGTIEREVNLDAAIADITEAVRGFFESSRKE